MYQSGDDWASDHADQAVACYEKSVAIGIEESRAMLGADPDTSLFDRARMETLQNFPELGTIEELQNRIGQEAVSVGQRLDRPKDIVKHPELHQAFPVYAFFIGRVENLKAELAALVAPLPLATRRPRRR